VVVQAEEVNRTVGYVVAGGGSVRMGRDKALLPWEGATLLDHAVARLRTVCGDVRILVGPARRYENRGVPVVADRVPDAGPLAGLDAALADAGGRPILFLGVDLPFVTCALLSALRASLAGADAAVPVVAGRPEPLCAAYGPGCLEAVRARLDAGERRMTSFWPDISVREVREAELAGLGDAVMLFRNLNRPEDLAGPASPRDKGPQKP
jgi:molybdopterin-guanine dinucleotide biosynthesis protein A